MSDTTTGGTTTGTSGTDTFREGGQTRSEQNVADASPPGRRLVIFADGTGNAFGTQESNVWRLYEALDRTKPDQIAYYIKGVGTAGWKPFAALDGATGIGVPSNVRMLYRFLCWNWKPGDKIYIFGFSRGAFTARTLAGMIASQGLVPAVIDDKAVSQAEMKRNAMAAWRAYRGQSVGWRSLPTVWVSRWLRNVVVGAYHRILGHRSYGAVRATMKNEAERQLERRRDSVHVEFLGLFDTVEAFGVPIEELRVAIDWTIWPISFRNYVLNDKIKCARHALSLDDERTTFHPLRIDRSEEAEGSDRIREVWFAGVHSDVGGGYPDGNLAYVPLVWMAGQVEAQLRFQDGRIDDFRGYQSALGPTHDSRKGAATMYRYGPRIIEGDKKDGGPPVVHHSVVTRMQQGCDNYAPKTLPANAKVWLPGPTGKIADMTEPPDVRVKSAPQLPADANEDRQARARAAVESIETMPVPEAEMARQTLDTVWWRRVAYFCLLWSLVLVAAWPFLAEKVVEIASALSTRGGVEGGYKWLANFNDNLVRVLDSTATIVQGFLPSFAHPWLTAARYYPIPTICLALIVGGTVLWSNSLRDRIHERARLAWFRPGRKVVLPEKPGKRLGFARFMRTNSAVRIVYKFFTVIVFPGLILTSLLYLALLAGGRSYFNWYAGRDTEMCKSGGREIVSEQAAEAKSKFDTKSMCWGSGLWVEKDRKYRIWITVEQPWFDRTIMSGPNGFRLYSPAHVAALPIRRWYTADWFQPIARFGTWGTDELPLVSVDATPNEKLPRTNIADGKVRPVRVDKTQEFKDARSARLPGKKEPGYYEPIEPEMQDVAGNIWKQQGLATTFVAEFIAPESGELYLYVNDAIQVFPFRGKLEKYYDNNSGTAVVKLQRVPLPPAPN